MMEEQHSVDVSSAKTETSSSSSYSPRGTNDDSSSTGSEDFPSSSSLAAASSGGEEEMKIPSSSSTEKLTSVSQEVVDTSSSFYDVSTTEEFDDTTTASSKSISSWEQLNKSVRSSLLSEGKRPTWREEWFGVHLPPSAVARGGAASLLPTNAKEEDDDEVQIITSSLPNPEDDEENEPDTQEAAVPVEEETPIIQQPRLPIVTPPDVDDNTQTLPSPSLPTTTTTTTTTTPPSVSLLSSLLSSSGPSIPLYPLLLLLTTIYILKQTFGCLFGYKNRTRVKRSMKRVLLNRKQFVIPKDQLIRHIDWMKRRNEMRRMRENNGKNKKKDESGFDENDKGGQHRGGGDGEGGGSAAGDGMNGSSGDRCSSSGGGGHQDNATNDDRDRSNDNGSDLMLKEQLAEVKKNKMMKDDNHNSSSNNNRGFNSDKETYQKWMVDQEKLQNLSLEKVERANEKILMLKEQLAEVKNNKMKEDNHSNNNNNVGFNSEKETYHKWMVDQEKLHKSLEKVEQLKTDNICANEKICMMKEELAAVTEKKDDEITLLKSIIEDKDQAIQESSEKAFAFENQCKELKEHVASLNEEIAVLELVCEKICSSGGNGDKDEFEGLEIEGASCWRSQLGSLTNMDDDEDDDDSMASIDTEWDRMEEENKLLRAENELLQESLDRVRKELDEARTDAASLSQELKYVKTQREVSSMNDLTMEMTNESFECSMMRSDSIPLLVKTTESIAPASLTSSSISAEGEVGNVAEDTIRLLLKCAYSATRVSSKNNDDNPNQDLYQDLLQLMANLRKLDGGDHTKENVLRANSPRKRGRTREGRDAGGRGRSRHRTGTKQRSKILTSSRLKRIKGNSLSRRDAR